MVLWNLVHTKIRGPDTPTTRCAGDYGVVNPRTGQWEPDGGNVYTDEETAAHAAEYPPNIGPAAPGSTQTYCSWNVSVNDVSGGPNFSAPGAATLQATITFQFSKMKGAAIFLADVQQISLPDQLLKQLYQLNPPNLVGKSLVTDVTRCRACYMRFSGGEESQVRVEFGAQAPLSVGSAGGSFAAGSHNSTGAGFETMCNFTEDRSMAYFPTFTLKKRRSKGESHWVHRTAQDEHFEHDWVLETRPWECLDEDGQEVSSEDEVDMS
ncbi:hypothetical protein C8R45DRAFT_946512 [Mycena sanguinolenta]|nr:hypothetical protein C8R45DRAFT_946512 [Mycena sanguinolenta]